MPCSSITDGKKKDLVLIEEPFPLTSSFVHLYYVQPAYLTLSPTNPAPKIQKRESPTTKYDAFCSEASLSSHQ